MRLHRSTQRRQELERYVARWIGPAHVADIAQETFLQIHRARRTYRPELPVRPWMFAIARHVAFQNLRTRGRRIVEEELEDSEIRLSIPSAETQIEARDQLEQAIGALREEQREVVWLSDVEGFTSGEIAKITGVSEGAVRVRLHRAHQQLRAVLGEKGAASS